MISAFIECVQRQPPTPRLDYTLPHVTIAEKLAMLGVRCASMVISATNARDPQRNPTWPY